MTRRLLCLLALPLLAACPPSPVDVVEDRTPPLGDRTPGIIRSSYLRSPALVAPAVVSAGQTFQATVTTLGFSGCWRADGAEVATAAATASIHPYDRQEGEVCTAALVELRRTVDLRFDTPGTAKIVVEGRSDPNEPQSGIVRVEQTVTVQ
ncbi:MAG TPA: hypothetical protein VEX86_11550 [Longimicrobium sp.]|nr:hypothetical protein [Longimicrobium sp.]